MSTNKILRSHGDPSEFPYPEKGVAELIENVVKYNIEHYGDSPWMTNITTGKSMSYSDLLKSARKVCSALNRRGFQQGDSVSIMAANFIEIVLVSVSVWKLGGSVSCLTLNLFARDIEERLKPTRPKFIFTDKKRAFRVEEAANNLDFVEGIFTFEDADCERLLSFDTLLQDDGEAYLADTTIDPNKMAWLMFSSGTTGLQKEIVHTYRSISAIVRSYTSFKLAGKRELFINLMVNSGGMGVAIAGTVCHAELYCLSDYSDASLLEAIDKVKPHMVSMFPSQIAWVCKHPNLEAFDTTSVRAITTGGSTINPIYERMIYDKFVNLSLLRVFYGLSETGMIATNACSFFEFERYDKTTAIANHIVGSCGKVIPYCVLKVINPETGDLLGPNETGEISVKTPFMMKEYLNQPKETERALRDGWFYTGDKGYYDEDKNIFVIGRYKELIKYRMAHVVPTNIEKHIMTHPAVEDVGVIGLPHDVDGELPLAFVVLREGKSATAEDIATYTDERVIDEERLRGGVCFIEKIPRNDFGKIIRGELTKLLEKPI